MSLSTQQKLDRFWQEYIAVGKEVLQAGKAMGYGMSLIEVKFQEGLPSVLIRSISQNTKYPTGTEAKAAIAEELEASERQRFDGARTMTVVYSSGKINRVILDEYSNRIIR